MPNPSAIVDKAITAQIVSKDEHVFKPEILECLATKGITHQEEGMNDAMFVVNGEALEYFIVKGRLELYGGADGVTVANAIKACVQGEDPQPLGGRKKKATRAKKRASRRKSKKLTRRR